MGNLADMFSGKKSRLAMMDAEAKAEKKRNELGSLNVSDEERRAAERTRSMAMNRDGRASTRLSDSILGGSAPLG
jgi:hypothetical protein